MAVGSALVRDEDPLDGRQRDATVALSAGYAGNTRISYTTDLRLFAAWCADSHVRLLEVRRAHLEMFAPAMASAKRSAPTSTTAVIARYE